MLAAGFVVAVTTGFVLVLGDDALADTSAAPSGTSELSIRLVGNAGVMLSDGTTSLLVDLPYEPGAFGYMHYDPAALRPAGTIVSVPSR